MEGGIDWPANYMKRFLAHFAAEIESFEKNLDCLCPAMILTIDDWERRIFNSTKIAESKSTYPQELFTLLGIPPDSDKRHIDLARARFYVKYPPQKNPGFALYIDDTISKTNLIDRLRALKERYSILIATAKSQQNITEQLRSEIIRRYAAKIRDVETQISTTRLPTIR
jgi:hypothetical protein